MTDPAMAALRRDARHEEALGLGLELLRAAPADAQLRFEVACLNDYLGHQAQAMPHKRAALAGPLDPASRRVAMRCSGWAARCGCWGGMRRHTRCCRAR
jgi:hypothetical protein